MNLRPSELLTDKQIQSGQKYILKDSLAGEAMVNLSGGAFITAMALHLGASNFQIGLLASLPILTNIFQLLSIWLVQRYNNRRAVAVIGSFLGRLPMLFAAFLPFMFSTAMGLKLLLVILFVHYFFGSIAGASWNAWVKDLIPEKNLGSFFSHRTRMVTLLSAILSLGVSFTIDYVKAHYADSLTLTYYAIFVLGGIVGLVGVYWLSRASEPMPLTVNENVFAQFKKPLKDKNFRHLLKFNAAWAFALNLATPFFTVFLMKTIGLSLSYVIGFTMIAQMANILTIKKLGRLSDRYSNKTIIHICAPIYVVCILAWTYAAMPESKIYSIAILAVISAVSGMATGGIGLALNNIGMKLAPRREAMAYMSSLNMVVAFFSAISPIIGGLLADFFSTYQLVWDFQLKGINGMHTLQLINIHSWSFLFIIGALMALASLKLLARVKEQGEVQKERVILYMRARLRKQLRLNSQSLRGGIARPVQKVQTLLRQAS
ncbi:MFS transporter [Mucilaginibacter lacusdianchii]|uniref:MFS transporter n=1 Tax=Mucilaginibacter lacusdianchii TaxID=2684211 RepID=UPI00131BA415|nr:MFS transporter [Mucilaginibacter sp. JXJ CY 39]